MERIDLHFTVKGVSYNVVIKVKENPNGKDYVIQLASDGEASPITFEYPIIRESGGYLHVDPEKNEVKLKVASCLSGRLNKPCFVGGKYLLKPDENNQNWMNFHPIAKRAQLR